MSTQQPGMPIPDQFNTLSFRITALEQQIADIRAQNREFELARENELKFQLVRDKQATLERDVLDIRREHADLRTQFVQQQLDTQKSDAKQRERQDSLVIRVFQGAAGFLIIGLISFLVNYFTHFIH